VPISFFPEKGVSIKKSQVAKALLAFLALAYPNFYYRFIRH
jgi:hypothetical protein